MIELIVIWLSIRYESNTLPEKIGYPTSNLSDFLIPNPHRILLVEMIIRVSNTRDSGKIGHWITPEQSGA